MREWKKAHCSTRSMYQKKYETDEIGQRILNGDGESWIKEPYDPETIYQLNRYHIQQEILRKISDKGAQQTIRTLLEEEKPEEMLEYIKRGCKKSFYSLKKWGNSKLYH